jgi:hypothetical protein
MLFEICFDLDTGDRINLAEMLPQSYLSYEYQTFLPIRFPEDWPAEGETGTLYNDYVFSEGSVITEAWFSHLALYMYVTEPDGRVLLAHLPLAFGQSL